MELLRSVFANTDFQIFLKLLLGALLTGVIGLERSSLNKPAGFGTHALLGVSSVLIVLSSEYLSKFYNIDMSRIPAQFISGIGFIGAGTILQDGFNVKGVTTAAGLLSATCIGLAVGSGYYLGAIFATLITYLILAYSHSLSDRIERFAELSIKIKTTGNVDEVIRSIEIYLTKNNISLKGLNREPKEDRVNNKEVIELVVTYDTRTIKRNKIISTISSFNNVTGVFEN
ncbi:MAG: MgtC/SapB family protein [Bacilli bacterium]|nr:MgtC/SapB family protein [Bacilli bacterium]